ncbi:MAG TPA: DUF3102 domain-containing protein [Chloroflexota bacterium]|nr:DUF3102 domain-containing protein [Chloroflexota bacterium]
MTTAISPAEHAADDRLAELAEQIGVAHGNAIKAVRTSLWHAKIAGGLLAEAKSLCPHGSWLPWLAANVNFGVRTAQSYMAVARGWPRIEAHFEDAQSDAFFRLRDALDYLTSGQDEPTEDAAINSAGELVLTCQEWVQPVLPNFPDPGSVGELVNALSKHSREAQHVRRLIANRLPLSDVDRKVLHERIKKLVDTWQSCVALVEA